MQVYRGANIISGKDKTLPTQLLDIVDPMGQFSVRNFVQLVRPIVKKAHSQHKIPIIVGGTGFYVNALFGKIDTISIPPNKNLREKLEKLSIESLQKKLKKTNPHRFEEMNNSDRNNKGRLIRAIEVAQVQGRTLARVRPLFKKNEILMVGLKTSMKNLRKRISGRVEKRIKMGALDEAKELFKNYRDLSPQIKASSGYRQMFDFLSGSISFENARQKWIISDYQLARRQMTWFRRNKDTHWFDIEAKDFKAKVFKLIKSNFKASLNS